MLRAIGLLMVLMTCAQAAVAGPEAKIKAALQKDYAQMIGNITQVNKSPIAGLYEVVTADHIFYTDKNANILIDGQMFDLKARRNLTEQRARQLFAVDFDKLPLDLAVKKVKGKGTRKMAYFTDPNCGFCKKLEHELQSVDDVTLYLFLYPIFAGSEEKVRNVWCSGDRVKAWDDLMLRDIQPASANCETPTAKVKELGAKMRVNGTPALVFANGVVVPGYLPAAELEKALSGAAQ